MSESHVLVMTDIVDSTEMVCKLGDARAAELWRAHDRLARDLLREWRGREVDKSDGFLLLFADCADALSYALAYHRVLATLPMPLRARAGVHVGMLDVRDNHSADVALGAKAVEVEGLAKPTTARIMSLASGGQTLLSAAARAALGTAPAWSIRVLGHWQFKGLDKPIELLEVSDSDATFAPPGDSAKGWRVALVNGLWLPTRELRYSLPAERDSFVGRRRELELLAQRFADGARLVAVLGTGGTGKTRLVARYALEALGEYPGGVWFCDLSQARTADGVHFAVAQGMEVALGSSDPVAHIAQAIVGRGRCLVVLDNFEQVARHAEATVGYWLDRAQHARFIVTTREVLGIAGEEVLPLSPLEVDDAAELFTQRASTARIGYVQTPGDKAAIRQLVTMLDGLPLAIELAAARVRAVPPHKLVDRVRDRFELTLAHAGRRDRQATLRATFDWSWDLLTEPEKAALASLSIFEGGFTLDSAAAVMNPTEGGGTPEILESVQRLVDKSFLRQVSDERYDLLETVRDYASRRLRTEASFQGSGESYAATVRARHWHYFAALGESQATAHRCVEANNLVAACRAAAEAGDGGEAARCLVVAWAVLRLTGPYQVAVTLAKAVAGIDALSDADQACTDWIAGDSLDMLGQVDASRAHLKRGLMRARAAGATECLVRLLVVLASRQTLDGDFDAALAGLQEANGLAVAHQHATLEMLVLNELGRHMDHQARWAEATECFERALRLARRLGDRRMEGGLLGNLGGLLHDQGELDLARRHYERSLELACELGDQRWEGNGRCNLGLLYQAQGRHDEAREQFENALRMARQVGHVRLEYTVLCNLGALLTAEGRLDEANEHLERAVEAAQGSGDKRCEGQFGGYLALNQARRGCLDQARSSLEAAEGLLLTMSDRLSYALLLCDRSEVETLAGCMSAARAAYEQARQLAAELQCGDDSDLCRRLHGLAPRVGASA
ncbi:ATP-binding protein [Aquabacterium sp.]|uniref:ATP-binding protein n=1 Tax=Aquabacterium sp. TaxID=1872578 RepID=UPI002B658D93|nr:tetratricopeptide repeat protein [Aquabacterium sp.]HSW07636.1 tetratricopeptide repeat protein [Aquabacterium sp.]